VGGRALTSGTGSVSDRGGECTDRAGQGGFSASGETNGYRGPRGSEPFDQDRTGGGGSEPLNQDRTGEIIPGRISGCG
jgi:hypothetical protein